MENRHNEQQENIKYVPTLKKRLYFSAFMLEKTEIFCLSLSNSVAFKAKLNHVLMGSVI